MSSITQLSEGEFIRYLKGNTTSKGAGTKAESSLKDYTESLALISSNGFFDKDESTMHSVIDTLQEEVAKIAGNMEEVDKMIDTLCEIIKTDILDREKQIAATVLED